MKRSAIVLLLVAVSAFAGADDAAKDDPLETRMRMLLRDVPLVDGHNDLMIHFHGCRQGCPRGLDAYAIDSGAEGHTDVARWRRGGVGAQLLNTGWIDNEAPSLDGTLRGFAFARELVARHPADLALARTAADVRSVHAGGRIAILLALEHPGRLGTDEATVRRLATEGLRSNILAYDEATPLADGHAGKPVHDGLSALGQRMVGWMQQNGVLVDLSHASADTARDVLEIATAPVIFSHSNAAALCAVSRNVPDDVLRRVRGNGGMVMATFVPEFVDPAFADWYERGDAYWAALMDQHGRDRAKVASPMQRWEQENPMPERPGLAAVADHIEHIRDVAGIDHVGIGGDFDGITYTVRGLEDVAGYPRLFAELSRRGWSDGDLRKLAGENFLRVLDAADVAARPAGVSPP